MSYEQSKISTRMYGKMINDICPTIKVSQGSGIYGEFKIKINRLKKWDSSIGGTYFRGQINGECDITITCDQSNSYFNRRHPK